MKQQCEIRWEADVQAAPCKKNAKSGLIYVGRQPPIWANEELKQQTYCLLFNYLKNNNQLVLGSCVKWIIITGTRELSMRAYTVYKIKWTLL